MLLASGFSQQAWAQGGIRNITVSQDQPYADHISMQGDATDKDIMVKFSFDEAQNQLTVSLISHRMIFVFWDDVRYKPMVKGRTIRPDRMPYVVNFDPSDKFRFSKLFKASLPSPRKKFVFKRWLDYEGMQPAPQEYSMVNDYITQTFDIQKKANQVVVRLRDVMLMSDVSKRVNKRSYEITFGLDLNTEYRVNIQRNPCFGQEEQIQSATAALDGIRKSYTTLKKRFGNGVVSSQDAKTVFDELKETLIKQYPRKDSTYQCPQLQQTWSTYNTYTDSIAKLKCKVIDPDAAKAMMGEGVNDRLLLSRARQIDTSVSRWLMTSDPIERRDIVSKVEGIIKSVNESVAQQGVYTPEQRQALSVFREAERYYKNNCLK
jgi:hypothetical protein